MASIQLSVLVFAQFFRARRMTALKKSKYPAKKENQIPFKYYRTAIATIIRYHKKNNDPAVFDEAIAKLQSKIELAEKQSQTICPRNNLRAIENYRRHFKNRKFKPEAIIALHVQHESVLVGAKPEMVVIENGERKLIRFDMKKKIPNQVEVDALLDMTYIAAEEAGVRVSSANVLLLRLEDGSHFHGGKVSTKRKLRLREACAEIQRRWNEI